MNFKNLKIALLSLILALTGCSNVNIDSDESNKKETTEQTENVLNYDIASIPDYTETDQDIITLNENIPDFSDEEKNMTFSDIQLSELDSLGRCGVAFEVIGADILPTEERKDIASIYPTGWHQENYDGTYVYNRSHLLAYCLSGLNDEKRNLITGTEHMNQDVMADYEVSIRDYVRNSNNHVVYRVTPDFRNNELVARGIHIEAWSVEDAGQGICLNIYLYNTQPGVAIDYETGYTSSSDYIQSNLNKNEDIEYRINTDEEMTFIINSGNGKFHTSDCSNANRISNGNRLELVSTVNQMIENGYDPAKCCVSK